jgi:hypothetical protein
VLAAVQELAAEFASGDTIVAISPDLGDKYMDTVYDPAWVENHSDLKAEERYAPIPLRLK